VEYVPPEDTSLVAKVFPIELPADTPLLPCGTCMGTVSYSGAPEAVAAADAELSLLEPFLRKTMIRVKHLEKENFENNMRKGNMNEVKKQAFSSIKVANGVKLDSSGKLDFKGLKGNRPLKSKLLGMLSELKRYTKTPRAVVGITASVLIMLGHTRLLDMLSNGLPEMEQPLKSIWDVTRASMVVKRNEEGLLDAMINFHPILENCKEALDLNKISRCSQAAVIFYVWLQETIMQFEVLERGNEVITSPAGILK